MKHHLLLIICILSIIAINICMFYSFSICRKKESRLTLISSSPLKSEIDAEYRSSDWEFLQMYYKNDCRTSQWRNKKTGKIIEVIGLEPPMKELKF